MTAGEEPPEPARPVEQPEPSAPGQPPIEPPAEVALATGLCAALLIDTLSRREGPR